MCSTQPFQCVQWCTVLLTVLLISSTEAVFRKMDPSYRLPSTIQPLQYNLTIEPNFENINQACFNGSITIKLKVMAKTDSITLHVRNLTINLDSIKIGDSNGTVTDINSVVMDNVRDFYIINLSKNLLEDQIVKLEIGEFSGKLKFDNVGFYLAKYSDRSNNERFLALTDFQPIGARKAFPCFDEPSLKSTFFITVIRKKGFISVSNAQLMNSVYLGNDRYEDHYRETVKMSTYLVAFSVSEYNHTVQKGPFQIYAKSDVIREKKLDYVLSIANDLLKVFEDYIGIKYAMSKLDMFAVPSRYFEPGGMENWGLITFSENNLICTNESTIEEIRKCTIMTAHEIAHQWFGNLVTPSWWNFLWLSEGFSTYMEYYTTSLLNPSWNMMDQFVVYILQTLLKLDVKTSQYLNFNQLQVGVLPPAYTTYYKGAAIVRMLEHVLTQETFMSGVRMYLKKYQYESVRPYHLYDMFEQAMVQHNKSSILNNLTVREIMSTWDSFPGYPLITVSRNYHNSWLTLSQEPFSNSNLNHLWIIPINFVVNYTNSTTADFWLKEKSIVLKTNYSSKWLLVNREQTGYYRVNYDLENWKRLTQVLNVGRLEEIHVLNRAQLIDDAFELANYNYIPYDVPLNLSYYLRRERKYIPFLAFFNNVEKVKLYLWSAKKGHVFEHYIKKLLLEVYTKLGFEENISDEYLDQMHRASLTTWLCSVNDTHCRQHALKVMRSWLENGTKIPINLEVPILCGAIQLATAEEWKVLYAKYENVEDSRKKTKLFTSLGCTGNEILLNRFLDLIFSNNNSVSVDDKKSALMKIVQIDQVRVDKLFNYFVKHFLDTNDMYQSLKISDVLCKQIISPIKLEVLKMLKLSFPNSGVIRSCVHQVDKNMAWLTESKQKTILNWFEEYQKNFMN